MEVVLKICVEVCWDLVDLVELEVLVDIDCEDWVVDALLLLSQASNITWTCCVGHSFAGSISGNYQNTAKYIKMCCKKDQCLEVIASYSL